MADEDLERIVRGAELLLVMCGQLEEESGPEAMRICAAAAARAFNVAGARAMNNPARSMPDAKRARSLMATSLEAWRRAGNAQETNIAADILCRIDRMLSEFSQYA